MVASSSTTGRPTHSPHTGTDWRGPERDALLRSCAVDEQLWDAARLRELVRRVDTSWRGEDVPDDERAAFRRQVRDRVGPVVQARVLESVGAVVDTDGVAALADALLDDGCSEDEHRWLLVSPDPWAYLADWLVAVVGRSYRRADGTPRARAKELKRLEKALRSEA
ncbi:hypothetical protein GCM10023221_04480 [Luteimicrobium xylanilyticum]